MKAAVRWRVPLVPRRRWDVFQDECVAWGQRGDQSLLVLLATCASATTHHQRTWQRQPTITGETHTRTRLMNSCVCVTQTRSIHYYTVHTMYPLYKVCSQSQRLTTTQAKINLYQNYADYNNISTASKLMLGAWLSGNTLVSINVVALRLAQIVLG